MGLEPSSSVFDCHYCITPKNIVFTWISKAQLWTPKYFVEILNFEGPFKFRIIFAKLETNKGPLGLVSMATMLRIHANVDAFLNGSSDILGKKFSSWFVFNF